MFTDMPVTPLHVESLIGFLQANASRSFTREDIRNSFQPLSIASSQIQSSHALGAAVELGLVKEGAGSSIELLPVAKGKKAPRSILQEALDTFVLSSTDVEDYLALFYSYMLGLNANFTEHSLWREYWLILLVSKVCKKGGWFCLSYQKSKPFAGAFNLFLRDRLFQMLS